VWRQLRAELHPRGLEIVTVALDLEAESARSWIERSGGEHPQLVDTAHRLDELLGIVNVPTALWVDEAGMIVRPPHAASVERYDFSKLEPPEGLPEDIDRHVRDMLEQVKRIPRFDADHYVDALRDWVEHGPASEFALTPDEVVARSAPRPPPVTSTTPAPTSAPLTASSPRTGPTSATPGSSSPPASRARPSTTTATGSATSRPPAPSTTTPRSISEPVNTS
jgi:hypothetical protein